MNMKRQGDKQSLFFYVGLLRIVNEYDYARKLAKKSRHMGVSAKKHSLLNYSFAINFRP